MKQLLVTITCIALCACAHTSYVSAPSTAAASAHVQSAADNVTAARKTNTEIASTLDRDERKAMLIDRWLETHKSQ